MNPIRFQLIVCALLLLKGTVVLPQEELLQIYANGRYEQVISQLADRIASGDTSVTTFQLKALAEEQSGHSDQAIHTLYGALESHPAEVRLMRMLARNYYAVGGFPEAVELYSQLADRDSSDLNPRLKLAEIAQFRQQYDQAGFQLNRILAMDSTNVTAWMMLGEVQERKKDSSAVASYERVCDLYPGHQKASYALGNLYIQYNVPELAIPVCERILASDSTNIRFRKLLGYACYKKGYPQTAMYHLQMATALGDSTAFTSKFLGISCYLAIENSRAIEALSISLVRDSLDAEVHFFLGACLGNTTRKSEAMVHLDRSLQLMAPDPQVVSRICSEQGNILRLEMKYEEAYARYEKAWEADTTNPLALYYMASILDNSLHKSRESLVIYQQFLDCLENGAGPSERNRQALSIRGIVEDRITLLKEELFFLDER